MSKRKAYYQVKPEVSLGRIDSEGTLRSPTGFVGRWPDRLWVRRTTPAGGNTTFDVWDIQGRHVGTAVAPFRVNVYLPVVIRGNSLYAISVDEDGVQFMVRARIAQLPTGAKPGPISIHRRTNAKLLHGPVPSVSLSRASQPALDRLLDGL
jgi:hypothetical protein